MNGKLSVLSAGVLFFIGQGIMAQKVKKDTISTKEIDEVLVVGYGTQKKKEVTGAVTSIKAADVASIAAPSFEQQLAGKAAGVQITSTTGILGEAPRVRIRGIASINSGTSPLYIVDGVPIFSGDIGGQTATNGLGDINPNDIETFEVLKDGAATAIYGSRAANGVILITTKKGKGGRLSLNFNNYAGYAMPVGLYKLLHTPDFITISNEKRANAGQSAIAVGTEYDTDWQKAVLRPAAFQTDNTLSASGSFGKSNYYTSIGYTNQEGIALPNEMKRYSTRANIDHQAFDWWKIGTSVSFTKTEYVGLNTGASSLSGNIYNATKQLPNTPIFNPNHPTGYNIDTSDPRVVGRWQNLALAGDNITNIVYALNNNKQESSVNRLIGSVYSDLRLLPYLNYRLQVSVDQSQTKGFIYWNPIHGDGRGSNGYIRNDFSDYLRTNIQNVLTFNKTFAEKHNITAVAVYEYQKQKLQSFYGGGIGLSTPFFNNGIISNSVATPQSGGGITEQGILSYAGRFNYNYAGKYFVQASIRRDGLSSLPTQNKWGNFPGFSVGWTVSKENFMEKINNVVSDFKVRASYAKVGNTDIGYYPYMGLFSNYKYADYTGVAYSQIYNPNLKWEASDKYDVGADFSLLKNKLKVTFDYFESKISDMILDAPLASSLGVPNNSIAKNIGDMKNTGYEFSVDYNVINTERFGLDVNANLTLMSNKVLALANNNSDIFPTANNIIRVGESLRSIYGYEYWGVNAANGNPVYYKADGSLVQGIVGKGIYAAFDPSNPNDVSKSSSLGQSDKRVLGNSLPKYFGAVSFKFRFYDFDLGTTVRFSGGNKIFNATRRDLMTLNFNNNSTEILGRWQSPSNPGDGWTPKLYAADNTFSNLTSNASSRFLEDGSFVKFDVISLGYNFPKDILKSVGIRGLRVYFQAQNAFIITKYTGLDPEMESAGVDYNGSPRQRVFSMGFNVSL